MDKRELHHALKILPEVCIGCSNCMRVCPTHALRISNGKAILYPNRCIDCGECERVCPVGIPLMLINRKLIKEVDHLYGPYEAGMVYIEGQKPPFSVYDEKDPDDFI